MTVERYEDMFTVQGSSRLVVKNIRGSVKVVPGEVGVIKVKAEKALNDGNADDVVLEVCQQGSTVYALVQKRERFRIFGTSWPCKVHFVIEAPPDTNLNIKTVSASVEASGFAGGVGINSVSGQIVGHNLYGSAELSTVSGRIIMAESGFSTLRAKTVSGMLEVRSALESGPYELSSVSGSIKLVTPEDANCDVWASGVSGRFHTNLNVRSSDIGNRSWRVRLGKGGAEVRMKTVSGRMSLVSSFADNGSQPESQPENEEDRIRVLNKLREGELTVEDALKALS